MSALLEIYNNWKRQLDALGKPYYLKIWLFNPDFSSSEVVCAIEDKMEWYDNVFAEADKTFAFDIAQYGLQNKAEIEKINWTRKLDIVTYPENFVGEATDYGSEEDYNESRKWFRKLLKTPHQVAEHEYSDGKIVKTYIFEQGNVWVGGI